jgi:pyruvate dehydrogenase (quinone)
MVFLGNLEHGCELPPMDFAMVARASGETGFSVENPADCGRVLDEALATPRPAIVEGMVGPFEPPLPAKITAEQALPFAAARPRGAGSRRARADRAADKVRDLE